MEPIKMLALDLDGTLAVNGHEVLPATRAALEALHASGVEVVIATGRRYRTTRFVIDNLGFDVYAVCNGGALLKSPTMETLNETLFPREQMAWLVEIARRHGLSIFAQRDAHGRGGADFIVDDAVPWSPQVEKYFVDNREWSSRGDLARAEEEFLVVGMMGEEVHLRGFVDDVHADYDGLFGSVIVPHIDTDYFYGEITQAHVHKWYGLSALCAHFGISKDNLCAAGDQLNDVPMLSEAAHSFAMGNGNPEVRRYAKQVCGAHDADGILEIVDYIEAHNARISAR